MSTKSIDVNVDADAGTEFVITDSRRVKVQGGAGRRRFTLPPGIYKARFMAGGLSKDQLFEVEEQTLTLRAPRLEIASPVPLDGTSTTHEYHQGAAHSLSRLEPLKLGEGSELSFLVRDSSKEWNVGPSSEPWHGLMLQRLDGITVVDFASAGRRDGGSGVAVVRAKVDPDTFLLTLVRKRGAPLQLPVIATPGWRTTVFLDCQQRDDGLEADLYGASVVISKLHEDFNPQDPVLKLAELAKLAIQKGRASVDAAALSGMMSEKFTYPMLGILAAHVLLIEKKPDLPTLKIVLKNLDTLVPGHPDVLALHCGLARHEPEHKLEALQISGPPMLRNSWELLVEASSRYPQLMPEDAEWMQYAYALSGSRVWLVWQRPPATEDLEPAFSTAVDTTYSGKASWNTSAESSPEPEPLEDYNVFEDRQGDEHNDSQTGAKGGSHTARGGERPERQLRTAPVEGRRLRSPASFAGSTNLTVPTNNEGRIDREQLVVAWSDLREALQDPSIAKSPLQSALRRKLLSLLEEDEGSHPVGTGGAAAAVIAVGAAAGKVAAGPVGTVVGAAIGAIAGGLTGTAVADDQEMAPTLEALARDLRVPTSVLIQAGNSLFAAAQRRIPAKVGSR